MSNESERDTAQRLTEAEVRRILERAASFDAGHGSLTVSELKQVAEEAGFSASAIATALEEVLRSRDLILSSDSETDLSTTDIQDQSGGLAAEGGMRSSLERWLRPALVTVGGLTLGLITRGLGEGPGPGVSTLGFIVLLFSSVMLALRHRRSGDLMDFELELAGCWIGFMAGWSAMHGSVWEDMVAATGLAWLISALVGGLIVSLRRQRPPAEPESSGG